MKLAYQTPQDDALTHQVRFIKQAGSGDISVSCNCRLSSHDKNGVRIYNPIGLSASLDQSRALYNDPGNHWVEFNDDDKAKW